MVAARGRCRWAIGLVALMGALAASAQPVAGELLIGQSAAFTGPLGELGLEARRGAELCLAQINAQGGVFGRQLRLKTIDDAYDPARTEANVRQLIEQDQVFALLGVMGTPNNEKVLPLIAERRVPFVAPLTGATTIRRAEYDSVFHVRASYGDEARKIAKHLATIGTTKVAVIHQNNNFGRDVLAAFEAALAERQLKPLAVATVENTGADAAAAVATVLKTEANAVVLATAGKPTVESIRALNAGRKGLPMYALSVMGTRGALKALGADGVGVVVSQVMPFPWNAALPLVREYQQAMAAQGVTEYSYLGLEGCLNARVLAEGLRRAGPNPSREKLLAALAGMKQFEIGKLALGYGRSPYVASSYVELSIIAPGERFRR
ncbi:ABC transporter substrate-binding protein [Aquincola sp. S2]|uniref:ABC transporter substrate-binding protein n=1 Tax=Pseudaquabacterium terrae TaxID=2732868 RepID=A0ABX2EIM1_9BURK|nr:ABC transporter substrate-binding protein [Aquabacterium terrae]NRF68416.1 ABC transporter substrate-binding protein [Aquabacterium terrae]